MIELLNLKQHFPLGIYILFALGFVLLVKGADWLVDGAAAIAKKMKVSDLVIGLTVVSFGTSAPELVGLRTGWHGLINNPDVSTIYPPAAQMVFLGIALAGGGLLLTKVVWVLFDLALAAFPALARGGPKGGLLALREGGFEQLRSYWANWNDRRLLKRGPPPEERAAPASADAVLRVELCSMLR